MNIFRFNERGSIVREFVRGAVMPSMQRGQFMFPIKLFFMLGPDYSISKPRVRHLKR
ncbi:MAG: hypothetical protein QG583_406 [Patescibacteria group bacterium]|nr:hypothetical protein [Patescibacteria group bacterium]